MDQFDTEWLRRQVVDVVRLQEAIGYGDKVMPCMVDGRELLLRAPTLASISALLWRRLRPYRPDVIAGMTLSADTLIAGVLLAAAADGVSVTGAIVRKNRKRYGLQKLIEGPRIQPGARVAIVDDLLNYGKTASRCVAAFRTVNARIIALGVLIDYGRGPTRRLMAAHGIAVESLFSMSDVGLAPRLPNRSLRIAPLWTVTLPGPAAPSLMKGTGGGGYTCSDGWLAAFTAAGELAWRRHIGAPECRLHLATSDALLASCDQADTSTVMKLDPRDGVSVWKRELPAAVAAVGLDEDRKLTIVGGAGGLIGLNSVDGTTVWQHDQPVEGLAVGPHCFAVRTDGKLLIGSTTTGRVRAERWVGAAHGRIVAANPAGFVTPVHRHGLLCVDQAGVGRWIATLAAGRVTAVTWTGRHWAVATSDGTLWLLDDERGSPISSYRTTEPADALAALDADTIGWSAGVRLHAVTLEPTTRRLAPPRTGGRG